jgi:flagellar hook-associated protein 3 FlgL
MRVSTAQFQMESISRMLQQQERLGDIQQKISTGRRLLTPSEDPTASARILDLRQVVDINEQYQRNSDMVQARLESQDITLTSMVDVFQRVRELAVQGLNDPLGQENRDGIAAEIRQQLDEVLSLSGRKDASGEYLFSGYKGNVVPVSDNGGGNYTYAGDQGQRKVLIGPNRNIEDSDNGFDLFFNVENTTENTFSAIYQLATDLENDTQSGANLDDIDAVMENLSMFRSRTGARLQALDVQNNVNEGLVVHSKELLSDLEDLDLAEAITELTLRQAGLEAAQQSYVRVQGLSLFNFL